MNEETIQLFFQAKALYFQNKKKLRQEEAQSLLVILLNQAKKKIREGELTFKKEVFSLYKVGMEEEILIENGMINEVPFLNIVMFGAELKQFNWVENFLHNYTSSIAGDNKQEIATLGKAYFFFFKEDYHQTIDLLKFCKYKNILIENSAKLLSLRSYYELFCGNHSYYEFLLATLQAYTKFLNRDLSLQKEKLEASRNFTKILKIVLDTKYGILKRKKKNKLVELIAGTKPLVAANWLKEKIEAI